MPKAAHDPQEKTSVKLLMNEWIKCIYKQGNWNPFTTFFLTWIPLILIFPGLDVLLGFIYGLAFRLWSATQRSFAILEFLLNLHDLTSVVTSR